MKYLSKIIMIIFIIFLVFPIGVLNADEDIGTETLLFENIDSDASDPLIIEGLKITTQGDGLIVRNCENVIIRNCVITYCAYTEENIPADFRAEGMGLLIEDCDNVTVENCNVSYNLMGLKARNSTNVTISNCTVSNNIYHAAIIMENCHDSLITGNVVEDNGFPERFYEAGGSKRIIGIYVIRGSDIEVSHNRSCRNTSDGIAVLGQNFFIDDRDEIWKGTVSNVSVHDNYIADNNEQGIWSNLSRNCEFYNNEIHMDNSDVGIGVAFAFDFDVEGAEVRGNDIYASKIPHAGGLTVSHNNYFHDNTLYTFEYCEFILDDSMIPDFDYSGTQEKAKQAGIPINPSYGNIDENNGIVAIGDPDQTVVVENISASADEPLVIEGLDISTDGDGMIVRNCENIVVRNCSITDCGYTNENIEPDESRPGMGLWVEDCSGILIEDSIISHNFMGMKVVKSDNVTIRGNEASDNVYHCGIRVEYCTNCLITDNDVENNGFPDRFYQCGGGKRIIGIYIVRGSDIEISHNRSVGNTSDGILVGGQDYMLEESEVWKGVVENVSVHDNYISENHEQGIWVARAWNCDFYNNEIHVDCSDIGIGSGINFELDVRDCEVYNNTIYACKVPNGAVVAVSHDNYFHDNVLYTFEDCEFIIQETEMPDYDYSDDIHKSKLAGLEHNPSSGNVSENNQVIVQGKNGDQHEEDDGDNTQVVYIAALGALVVAIVTSILWIRRKKG